MYKLYHYFLRQAFLKENLYEFYEFEQTKKQLGKFPLLILFHGVQLYAFLLSNISLAQDDLGCFAYFF